LLIAETQVEGERDEASRAGFRLLADFIFGNNQAAGQDGSTKIAMTAPVTVEPQAGETGRWRIQFVMPSHYTLASIPKPRNPAVQLRGLPSQWWVAHRFSGFTTDSRVQAKTREAVQWVEQQNLKATGSPQLARYDPPWTLPMFRRNEILIPVAPPQDLRPQ
jgi:hypothetical protein